MTHADMWSCKCLPYSSLYHISRCWHALHSSTYSFIGLLVKFVIWLIWDWDESKVYFPLVFKNSWRYRNVRYLFRAQNSAFRQNSSSVIFVTAKQRRSTISGGIGHWRLSISVIVFGVLYLFPTLVGVYVAFVYKHCYYTTHWFEYNYFRFQKWAFLI